MDRRKHWETVWETKREDEVSWFQPDAEVSLDLISRCGLGTDSRLIDVGGGASRLVDALLARGFERLTVLDLAEAALATARARLGDRGRSVRWLAADVTRFTPDETYDLWHDRAVFHFLTDPEDRAAYVRALEQAVGGSGHVIVGTFALDGPERCSGLEIVRYDAASLALALGPSLRLVEERRHEHRTPGGKTQAFTFARFVRV